MLHYLRSLQLICLLVFFALTALAQSPVSGKVMSEQNEGIPGVTVSIKGTTRGTTTDADGAFRLNAATNETLVFSYVGYTSQEAVVGSQTNFTIKLVPDTRSLEEIVVVGYGTQRRQDLTGSIASVKGQELAKLPIASVQQGLQGRVAGVQVTQSSGQPGGGVRIRIRGANSISAGNNPLFVVDGLPIDDGSVGAGATARNPLNMLNPNDIESIEVLKDASASAIYGSRASNGVVIITTKKGTAGRTKVEYGTYVGIQEVSRKVGVLTAPAYMTVLNDIRRDRGEALEFKPEDIQRIGAGTDWQDAIFRQAPIQNHQLSFSGGSDKTRYFASLNYFNQQGIVRNSGIQKYIARLNLDQVVSERFKFGINLTSSLINDQLIPEGNDQNLGAGAINSALQADPTLPIYDQNGKYTVFTNDLENPVALLNERKNEVRSNRTFGNIFGELTLAPGLKARINLAHDTQTGRSDYYASQNTIVGAALGGQARVTSGERWNSLLESTVSYDRTFGTRHVISAVAGYTFQKFTVRSASINTQGFPSDFTGTNNVGLGAIINIPGTNRAQNQLLSYLGRVNYRLDDKYLITASLRADGSSRFGANSKFGYFPSIAFAWRMSDESFMKQQSLVEDLKFRVSYGLTGNQEIGNYNSLVLLTPTGSPTVFNEKQVPGVSASRIANPDLKWEQTAQFNAGLDFALLKGRVSGSFDYFVKNTSDLLLAFPLPTSSGYGSITRNIGEVRNSGFEVSLTSRNSVKALKWTTTANLFSATNRVVSLGGINQIITGAEGVTFIPNFTIIKEGYPINSYYGYVVDGIVQQGETLPAQPTAKPGELKIKDTNADGRITPDDRTILGSAFPKLNIGLNNEFSYKRFTLSAYIQGVSGVQIFNANWANSDLPINFRRNRFAAPYLDRWSPQNPTNNNPSGLNPNAYAGDPANSRSIVNASYLRLQTVNLGYRVPLGKSKIIRQIDFYISGQNLLTLTPYDGYNPDVSSFGNSNVVVDYNAYPLARTYTAGINVSF